MSEYKFYDDVIDDSDDSSGSPLDAALGDDSHSIIITDEICETRRTIGDPEYQDHVYDASSLFSPDNSEMHTPPSRFYGSSHEFEGDTKRFNVFFAFSLLTSICWFASWVVGLWLFGINKTYNQFITIGIILTLPVLILVIMMIYRYCLNRQASYTTL